MSKAVDKLKTPAFKTFLSITISLLFIAYIVLNRHSIFGALKNLAVGYLLLVVLGQIGVQVFNGLLLRSTVRPLNKNIGVVESIKLTSVASFINFFTPVVGGASVRAVYLKKRHNLAYASFIGVTYGNYLIIFLASFLVGLIGLFSIPNAINNNIGQIVGLFFAAGMLGSGLFMAFGHKITEYLSKLNFRSNWLNVFIKKISLVNDGWLSVRRNPKAIIFMSCWSVCTMLCVVLVYWAAMRSIGLQPSAGIAVIFAALGIVGLLFNITPGSIGIREAVFAAVFSITSISPQEVVAFSLVDRTVLLLLLGAGWIIFSRAIMSRENTDNT